MTRPADELRALWRRSPVAARADILAAFEIMGGNAVRAAELLGIGHRTLLKLMQDPGIAAGVARIREAKAKHKAPDPAPSEPPP